MIETGAIAWAGFLAIVGLASFAGIAISTLMPWSDHARFARIPFASGIVMAPFLTGLAAVSALLVLPRAPASFHIGLVATVLALFCLLSLRKSHLRAAAAQQRPTPVPGDTLLRILLALWCVALLVNAIFVPLTQNDALEYATVGRLLYESRTLDVYPVLDSATNLSGFFGPWTHPPLYVALIYLTAAIQGHADEPGLMRLVAPWFLLSATVGVVALGSLRKPTVGLVSGVLFISTPLLFLGADSALIDALSVSGMLLLFMLLAGLKQQGTGFGMWLGLGLAFGLWTHSQAILFVPLLGACLLGMRGLTRWRMASKEFAIALLVAATLAGWPYWKNVAIFGTPISDNPAVFALRELDWQGYFRFARGLDTWPAILQYGVLKGWFSVESYGVTFWLMALGLSTFWIKTVSGKFIGSLKTGFDRYAADAAVLWLAAGLILTYLAGVLVSVLLGLDLMIRNERYILVIMPAVAICAAFGMVELGQNQLRHLSDRGVSNRRKDGILAVCWIVVTFALIQLVVVGWYYRWRDVPAKPDDDLLSEPVAAVTDMPRFERILAYWSSLRTMQQMAQVVPKDAFVLTMRPADMYYSTRSMVSYLDPRMLPVYREGSATQTARKLQTLGVQYIHLVDYSLPPLYNSTLQEITARPELSQLEYSFGMTQIYSLGDSGLREGPSVDITPGNVPWRRTQLIRIGGKKAFGAVALKSRRVTKQEPSISSFPFFHRDYSVEMATTIGSSSVSNAPSPTLFKVDPGSEYVLKLHLEGRGFVRVWLQQFDAKGVAIDNDLIERSRPIRIGELSLTEQYPSRVFWRRFKPLADTKLLRLGVEHVGQSSLSIKQATVTTLVAPVGK